MANKVKIIKLEELQSMHTGTLMSRRAALLKCEESFESSDRLGYEAKPSATNTGIIEFKDSEAWKRAYEDLKSVLATRENLPNKRERKAIRQAKAKS
jgi:hypothetical protein